MAIRLTPHDRVFHKLFEADGDNLASAAQQLTRLLEPDADRAAVAATLREHEHAGDSITHDIFRQLNTSFVTPFDREDIYALASRIDDVMDGLDEVADFLVLADVGPLPDLIGQQIEVVCSSCQHTAQALKRLATLQELEPYWIEVNRLENVADDLHRQMLSRLFRGEWEIMQMLKLRELADLLENATDALEHVAHAVETIAVKES